MAREATLSVSLTNQLRSYVREKVASGQYESASEVIRHGLRTLQEQERRDATYWPEVRKKVQVARDAIARGDVVDGATCMRSRIARLKAKLQPQKKSRKSKTR